MEKILSVSIAAYNTANTIERCLDTFIKSKYIDELELLIINDGSSDNIENIVRPYCEKYPTSVIFISKENGGHGSTINTSIELCTGRYYKIVDADDWVETNNLDCLIEYLRCSETDIIFNSSYTVNMMDNYKKVFVYPNKRKKSIEFDNINIDDCVDELLLDMHWMTVRKEVVKKMGPIIDENCFYVDMEFVVFVLEHANTVTMLSDPIYDYLVEQPSQSISKNGYIKNRNDLIKLNQRLICYYNSLDNSVSECKKKLIYDVLLRTLLKMYYIYLAASACKYYKELRDFDLWLKTNNIIAYNEILDRINLVSHRLMLILKLFRLMNFRFSFLISKLIHIYISIKY